MLVRERLYSERYLVDNRLNDKYYLILFVIWPFLSFLLALSNFNQQEARRIVYFFIVYYGATIALDPNSLIDAVRYGLTLKSNSLLPFSHLYEIVGSFYVTDDTMDIIEPLLSFLISRLTSDYRVLFAVFAAIFGLFYLKSINLLHIEYRKNSNWNALIYLVFFSLILPVTSISGFRMWTAAWIFFYGAYHVVVKKDLRYFLLSISAILVHWSFVSMNVILLLYYVAGNKEVIYIPLAISSFIMPYLITPFLEILSLKLGGGFQARYNMYADEAYVQARQAALAQTSWFIKLGADLVLYYLSAAMMIIKIRYGNLMKDNEERNLFNYTLLLLTFVNFGKTVPSLGNRFQILFFLFATVYVFRFFIRRTNQNISFLTLLGAFPMLLFSLVTFRQGSETINAWMFAPGFGIPWLVSDIPLVGLLF